MPENRVGRRQELGRQTDGQHAVEIDVDQPTRHGAELDCDVLRVAVELRGIKRALLPARADRLLGLAAYRDWLPAARMVGKRGSRDG